jgi:hypothetical protein
VHESYIILGCDDEPHEGLTRILGRFHNQIDRACDVLAQRDLHADGEQAMSDAHGCTTSRPMPSRNVLEDVSEAEFPYPGRHIRPSDFRDEVSPAFRLWMPSVTPTHSRELLGRVGNQTWRTDPEDRVGFQDEGYPENDAEDADNERK